jgi:hypothetical protein
MAREYPEYRNVIEDLRAQYGNVEVIKLADFAERNRIAVSTLRRMYNLPARCHFVGIVPLAHKICEQVRG